MLKIKLDSFSSKFELYLARETKDEGLIFGAPSVEQVQDNLASTNTLIITTFAWTQDK